VLPIDTARLLCERAEERWHTRSGVVTGEARTVVQVWPPQRTRLGLESVAMGAFVVAWGRPAPSEATIDQIEWDPNHGGSESAVRDAINALVGWPVANDTSAHAAPTAVARPRDR
jgi:hypothetical protein